MSTRSPHRPPEHPLPVIEVPAQTPFASVSERFAHSARLAIDTEFERTRTYFARLGLLQLSDGDRVWLVDPLAGDDLSALRALLPDAARQKVLHSGSEDLELLGRFFGTSPSNVFDTQIAAGLAGLAPAMSYRDLVRELRGVLLEKGETRSDWLARPLSESQRHYAALDVTYLLDLREELGARLERLDRLPWLEEDCERLIRTACAAPDLHRMFAEFKLAWKLDRARQAVLWAVLVWREDHARRRDVPRRRALDDEAVLALAQAVPADVEAVAKVAGLGRRKRQDVAGALADVIARAGERSDVPPPPAPPLDREGREELKRLKAVVTERARDLQLDPAVLASRRDLVALYNTGGLPERLGGWRREAVGEALLEAIAAA